MKTLDFASIDGSKDRPWFAVLALDVTREAAADWFERPPHVAWNDGLGNADYWAVEFDCGLQIGFEFLHYSKGGLVYASEPVAQHVSRHLRHWKKQLHTFPADTFETDRRDMFMLFAEKMPGLIELEDFQLWRQGDDGNEMPIGDPTSKWDAECWRAELESHKHKQTYWITRVE